MIDIKQMRKDLGKSGTLYCSVMAHLRGKLHMTKLHGGTLFDVVGKDCWSYFGYNNKECIADERRHIFHWTMEDQAKFVEETINKYRIEDRQEKKKEEVAIAI